MASDGLKTFQLQLEDYRPNAATLRTDIAPSAGTAKGPGFYVDFKIVYEVHGGFEPPDRDNASLLVIRIVPFPKDIERQFLSFSVKLSVQAAAEKKRQSTFHDDDNDENKMPQFRSFEPASQGQQFVDVYTTNETRERMAQLNGQVPIMQAASFGGQLSATNKSEFTRTHILKVSSREERDDLEVPHNVYNRVAWTISAANKDQGIGDSFTVALLVKRPPGSRFRLAAEVDGDVGSFLAKTKKFVSLGIGGKKPPTLLASFPSHPSNQKVPRGVDVGDLHRASTDNVMRDIKEVGLHLPEQANPVKVNQAAVSATSLELGLMKFPGDDDNPSAGMGCSAAQSVESPSATMHQVDIDDTVGVVATTTNHDHQAQAVPRTSTPGAVVADLLTGITQQLRLVTGGLQQGSSQLPTQPPLKGSMLRVRRHREMAALYERLAELHREEAKEFLPPEETAYAAGFEGQQPKVW